MSIFKNSIFFSLILFFATSLSNIVAVSKRKLSYPEKTRRFFNRNIKPILGGLTATAVIVLIAIFCSDRKKKLEAAAEKAAAEPVVPGGVPGAAQPPARPEAEERLADPPVVPVPAVPVGVPEPVPGAAAGGNLGVNEEFYRELLNNLQPNYQQFLIKEFLTQSKGNNQCIFSPSQNMFSRVREEGESVDLNTCSIFAIANAIVDRQTGAERIKEVQRLATKIFNCISGQIGIMLDITDTIKYVPENFKLDMNYKNIVYFTDAELNRQNMPQTYEEYMRFLITNIDQESCQTKLRSELVKFYPEECPQVFIYSVLAEDNIDGNLRALREVSLLTPKTLESEAKSTSPWAIAEGIYAANRAEDPCGEISAGNQGISDIFKKEGKLAKIKHDGHGKFIIRVNGNHFICVDYDQARGEANKFILRDSNNPGFGNVAEVYSRNNLLENLQALLSN